MADEAPVQIVPGDRLLKVAEVEHKTGLSRTTIWRRIGAGEFPTAVKLGGQTVRWRESEVDRWIAHLPSNGAGGHSSAA